MTKISDLSLDMVGEIMSRVPWTSLTAVRSTCKTWNDSSKNQVLGEKAARKDQFLELKIIGNSVCSLRFDLQGYRNDKDERHFSDPSMKQISIPNYQDEMYKKVHHCDGLLLCLTEYKDDDYYSKRLLVWNPYLGQTRWIRQRSTTGENDTYALGYGYNKNSNRNYKILRSFYHIDGKKKGTEVYDLSSDSWRVLDVSPELLHLVNDSVFVKGNTYLLGMTYDDDVYLVCFDFTRERFGPRLPLPFPSSDKGTVTLSCVRDEKLAALHSHDDMMIEIWILSKTEPNAVSWSPFLKLDMSLMNAFPGRFLNYFRPISFFIDEEKKVAVLFDLLEDNRTGSYYYQMGYIFGKDGYFKSVKSGLVLNDPWYRSYNFVCSSYVPSLVQLQINQPKERNQQEETQEVINQPDERKETIEEIKQPETNQREEKIEEIKQPDERKETIEEIKQPEEREETKEEINQPEERIETKEQRKETNQPGKSQERNHEQQINKERRERNKRSKMRKRNQRVKRKERDDDQSLPFSLPFLFLALFISSFVFFFFFILFSVHL